jgi:hypothetical protein
MKQMVKHRRITKESGAFTCAEENVEGNDEMYYNVQGNDGAGNMQGNDGAGNFGNFSLNTVSAGGECWDDVSGKTLCPKLVKKAREEEMKEFTKHGVYMKVPLEECYEVTGKDPIGTKWIDTNKGDESNPEIRSRLVAQEIKRDKRDDLFAATPPLEAIKMLLSLAVTEGVGYTRNNERAGMKLEFIDVKRAYFHAPAKRDVYVRLPNEDAEKGKCGKLLKSMYGTRDAAQNWEEAYTSVMSKSGFQRGIASPCLFYHRQLNLRAVIHGDDLTLLGHEKELNKFREAIKASFEVKFRGRLGPSINDDRQVHKDP